MSEYKVVTVCSRFPQETYYCLTEWFKSLKDNQPLVLGQEPGEYGGLGSKPRLLYSAIKSGLIPEKYIIFSDCYDLVFSAPLQKLISEYLLFKSPVVISAEKNCFPEVFKAEYDKLAEDIISPYKYLNSGLIVGETEAILTTLESIDAKNIPNDYWDEENKCMINPNDQEYYQEAFLKQPVPISLDRYQVLCNTLHNVELDELDFSQERIFNKVTQSFPCSWHLNGGAKTGPCRDSILKHLGL
jgi:hypothetical protein